MKKKEFEKLEEFKKKVDKDLITIADEIEKLEGCHLQHHAILEVFKILPIELTERGLCYSFVISSAKKGLNFVETSMDSRSRPAKEEVKEENEERRYIG